MPLNIKGLTKTEVDQSRKEHGSNELTSKKRKGFLGQFLEAFGDPIIKVLLIALAINVVFLFRDFDWYETAGIAIAIFLATFVSTLSEYGSESAFAKLQEDSLKTNCRVKRNRETTEVPVGEVVVGDMVLLQAGERVPADGEIIWGALSVDQSALNGESKEAKKAPEPNAEKESKKGNFLDKRLLFRGSVVCGGEGVMQVAAVGDKTFYGSLATEIQEETRESPLKLRLTGLAKTLSRLGYVAAFLVGISDLVYSLFIQNSFSGISAAGLAEHILHALTLAITVVVVAVPEGLPMMITVVLSSNMRRMLKDKVLVRKLVGIETSGSLNILFTDKTGTLTKGRLEISSFITGEGEEIKAIEELKKRKEIWKNINISAWLNTDSEKTDKGIIGGNATDRAILEYVSAKTDYNGYKGFKIINKVNFDSSRKYSAVTLLNDGRKQSFVKGAPEKILSGCKSYIDNMGEVKTLRGHTALYGKIKKLTGRSARVIAIAYCEGEKEVSEKQAFPDLTLIGLVAIRDEMRKETPKAVMQINEAGIQTVIVTGDNLNTAVAVAREAGVLSLSDNEREAVLTSDEMAKLSDDQLKKRLSSLRVVARALPSDKSRLIKIAQSLGLVAGMTGDGINDAPALKKADVGFAMGSGTEVAKEAGDIVILDDNIASIAKAVLYGRTIFKSIRKFIIFQLTMNLCAVGISIIGPFIGIETPVTVIQMLWINIIMDTLAGLAFAGEAPLDEYMKEKPKKRNEPIINKYMTNQILSLGFFTVVLSVFFLKTPYIKTLFGFSEGNSVYFMTAFFALFIFAGIFNSFNARTYRINLMSNIRRNMAFLFIMVAVAAVQLLLIYFGGSLFRTKGLSLRHLQSVLMIALVIIPIDMIRKLVIRLKGRMGHL